MIKYRFRTKNFEVQYEKTEFISYAIIMKRPVLPEHWPIGVAVDVSNKISRQRLIIQSINDTTKHLLKNLFPKKDP